MTVPTQPVSGKLADFGGASVAGVIVTAKLSDVDYTADGTFVGTEPVTTVTDAGGNFVLNVFPNAVAPTGLGTRGTVLTVTAHPPKSKSIRVEAVIPNAPCNLVDHLVSEEQNGLNGSERAAFDAQAARDLAKDWATKTSGEVVAGQGFGALKYAQDAASDAQQTGLDRVQTGQDRVATGQDRVATGADRAQTGADRVAASADRVAADAAKVAAEAARDAANTTGKVFTAAEGTAAGIAATVNGQQFAVVDASLTFWIVYRNNAGAPLEIVRNYAKAYLDQWLPFVFETLDTTLPQGVVLDSQRRIIQKMAAAAHLFFETIDSSFSFLFLDSRNRILASIPKASTLTDVVAEVTAARGDQAALATRLSHGLTPYGDPIQPYANAWALRECRMRLRKRALGESVQLVLAFIGDSYTQAPSRYVGPLAKLLQDTFGSAGMGWVSFAWFGGGAGPWSAGSQPTGLDQGARYDLLTVFQIIGTWTCTYNTPSTNTPSLSYATSSTAGDYVRFTVPAGHNACRLFYGGDGTGVVQVSWDDGATYSANIALNTVGAGNTLLAGIPAGAVTARIKVISGNVSLAGVDLQSANPGVRVHKLGGSGSTAAQWASVTAATWAAQIQQLGSHMHQVMHGTNDQSASTTPATFASKIASIFANIATVLPYSDKLVVMPAENQRLANTYGMPAYAQATREWAVPNDAAFCDLQYFFGSTANFAFEYAFANPARQWYAADLIHPDPNTGGRVIVDAEYRLLTSL